MMSESPTFVTKSKKIWETIFRSIIEHFFIERIEIKCSSVLCEMRGLGIGWLPLNTTLI
jgi:hypothetical protein